MKKIIFSLLLGSFVLHSSYATASYYSVQSNTVIVQQSVNIPSVIRVERDPYERLGEAIGACLAQAIDYHFAKKAVKKYLENPTVENYLEASKYVDLPKLLDALHKAEAAIKQQQEHEAKLFLKNLKKTLPAHVQIGEFVIGTCQQYQAALQIIQDALNISKKNCWLIEGTRCRKLMNQFQQQYFQISQKNPYLSFKDKPFPLFSHLNEYVKTDALLAKKIKYFGISSKNKKAIIKQLRDLESKLSNELAFLKVVVNSQSFDQYY